MSHPRIPSPARSQGAPVTPRRLKSRTRSVGSPARSTTSERLSALIQSKKDSFFFSPAPSRRSVLNDDTDIEEPRRRSWWKNLADNSRDVLEVLNENKILETNEAVEEYIDIEVLSQEKKNYSIDIPESSDSESISSIIIPQRKLFTQKDLAQNKFGQLIGTRETLAKLHKSHVADKSVSVAPKNLFGHGKKTRTKPVFPAALLNLSPNKTDKTKENVAAEVKGQVRNLFGNRAGTKRKNMFADFIVSESEDEISEIQPKVFGFPKKADTRRDSANSRGKRERSPTSSITTDIEMDDWNMLPSSTMVENQLEDMMAVKTPVKRARLSKLAETKECDTKRTANQIEKEPSDEEQELKYDDDDDKSDQNEQYQGQFMPDQHEFEEVADKDQHEKIQLQNSRSKHTDEKEMAIGQNKFNQECIQNKSHRHLQNISKEKILNLNQSIIETAKTSEVDENEEEPQKQDEPAQQDSEIQSETEIDERVNDIEIPEESDEVADNESEEVTENESEVNEHEDKADEHKISIKNEESQAEHDVSKMLVENEIKNQEESDNAQDKNEAQKQNENIAEAQNESEAEMQESQLGTKDDKAHQIALKELEDNKVQNDNKAEDKEHQQNKRSPMHNKSANIQDEMEEDMQNGSAKTDEENDKEDDNKSAEMQKEIDNKEVQSNAEIGNEENDHHKSIVKKPKVQKETEDNEVQNDSEAENGENEMQHEIIVDAQNGSNNIVEEIDNKNQNDSAEIQEEIVDEDQNDSAEIQGEMEDEEQNESDEMQAEIEEEQNESSEIQQEMEDEDQNESAEMQEENEDDEQNESAEMQEENEDDEQNESAEMQEENEDDEQNESSQIQEEMEVEEQNENAEIQEDTTDDEQDQSAETQDEQEEDVLNQSQEAQEASEEEIQDSNKQQESDNEQETRNETHDTTGRYRKKNETEVHSPEAILHDKTNQLESFTAQGRNTSIRKTTMLKNLNIRPSLVPPRESTGLSDGTRDSSAEDSGWDSHRTTRKTLRQTFGRDFTPRKSLRALVMEKSAKRQTAVNEMTSVTAKFPQANSTELPEATMATDDTEIAAESIHDVSKRTRQTTLEMYLQKIKKQNMERKLKMEEAVRNSLKAPTKDVLNPFKVPSKPIFSSRKPNKVASKSKARQVKSTLIPLEDLPAGVIEDMKYKPPKRFQPSNASWITKRLYKFLESKLESKYDYKARVRAEKLVETIYHFTKDLRRVEVAPSVAVDALKNEMARLDVVKTHFDFYQFFHDYMPREIRVKVVPDVVNRINVPRHGVFSDIIRGNTVQG